MTTTPEVIAIIGRPNVGKSSLFNRLVGRRVAIVHEQSGVTRDRIVAPVLHGGRRFLLVDTGGLGVFLDDHGPQTFETLIRAQIKAVIDEATRIMWVVDARDGVIPLDKEVATMLRGCTARVRLVANKADNERLDDDARSEFAQLGFGEALPISCLHNRRIAELKNWCAAGCPQAADDTGEGIRLAIVGRPNVGKSSLVNRLLGEERVIVSETAGTTRDAVDIPVEIINEDERVALTLIDTAGLRRRREIGTPVELFSVMRAENAVRRSDIVLLVIDATQPATSQDRRIARLIAGERKPCIIIANKWDLAGQETKLKELRALVREKMAFMRYAPIVGLCALSGYNLAELLERVLTVQEQMSVTIPTALLNQFLQDTVMRTPPPATGGRHFKLFYATMIGNAPPHFLLFVNDKRLCLPGYQHFIENRLRDAFFPEKGVPIWLELRPRPRAEGGARRAASGVARKARDAPQARQRHRERRKGWRKK